MSRRIAAVAMVALLLPFAARLSAAEFKVAITQTVTAETFSNFIKAIAEATGNTVVIQLVPRARAIHLLESQEVDIQLPNAESTDPAALRDLKYDYSTAAFMKSAWVLYSKKSVSVDELKQGNPKKLVIETETSLTNSFGFAATGSTNLEGSLKKVNDGTIDGYIYSQATTDVVLKKLGYKNIRRQLFSNANLRFALRKGAKGGPVDKMLSDGLAKLKANGKFDELMAAQLKAGTYDDWQP